MGCSEIIREKRSRETKLYTVVVYDDIPKAALVDDVLSVIVDDLSDDDLDALGSGDVPLEADAADAWTINDAAFTDRDGSVFPVGKCMQGNISGGNNGYTYTVRVMYSRDDDPGPHEATFLVRIKDEV
jgi:hypothetical protein